MNDRLIRAAIALYPLEWRQRYGDEFEQVIVDACETSAGIVRRAWLVAGVAVCGFRERVRNRVGRHGPLVVGAMAALAAGPLAMLLFSGGDPGDRLLTYPPTPVTLAPHARIDPRYIETHDVFVSNHPKQREIVVGPNPPAGRNVLAVIGPPAVVKLNPKTDQITSIEARSH